MNMANMGNYEKFIKSWTKFWMECANSGSLGKWSEPRRSGKHAGVASWDNFTQVKGPFICSRKPFARRRREKKYISNTILRVYNKIAYFSRCF